MFYILLISYNFNLLFWIIYQKRADYIKPYIHLVKFKSYWYYHYAFPPVYLALNSPKFNLLKCVSWLYLFCWLKFTIFKKKLKFPPRQNLKPIFKLAINRCLSFWFLGNRKVTSILSALQPPRHVQNEKNSNWSEIFCLNHGITGKNYEKKWDNTRSKA